MMVFLMVNDSYGRYNQLVQWLTFGGPTECTQEDGKTNGWAPKLVDLMLADGAMSGEAQGYSPGGGRSIPSTTRWVRSARMVH